MVTLGLDISTTTAGFALINESGQILKSGFVDISKKEKNKDKAYLLIDVIKSTNIKFDKIHIEDALSGFSMGRTRQQIVIKLAKANAVISYIVGEHFLIEPVHSAPTTVRKKVFGKAIVKGMKSKEYVRQQVSLKYNLSSLIIKNKKGNEDKRNEDMLDAIVMALWDGK